MSEGSTRDGEVLADDVGDRLLVARDERGRGAVDREDRQSRRGRLSEEAWNRNDPAVEGADAAVRLRDVVDLEDAREVRVRTLQRGARDRRGRRQQYDETGSGRVGPGVERRCVRIVERGRVTREQAVDLGRLRLERDVDAERPTLAGAVTGPRRDDARLQRCL